MNQTIIKIGIGIIVAIGTANVINYVASTTAKQSLKLTTNLLSKRLNKSNDH